MNIAWRSLANNQIISVELTVTEVYSNTRALISFHKQKILLISTTAAIAWASQYLILSFWQTINTFPS